MSWPLGTRIAIDWGGVEYEGVVDEHRVSLVRDRPITECHVSYDNGDKHWHHPDDAWEYRVLAAASEVVSSAADWQRIETRCCLSMQALTDPACGAKCGHAARCNYQELRDYAARTRACPVAGCLEPIKRTRDIVRDDSLRGALSQARVRAA